MLTEANLSLAEGRVGVSAGFFQTHLRTSQGGAAANRISDGGKARRSLGYFSPVPLCSPPVVRVTQKPEALGFTFTTPLPV